MKINLAGRTNLKDYFSEFIIFIKKQASCSLFGGLMLFCLIVSKYVSVSGIYRYDLLFLIAVLVQIILITKKLETPREVIAIIIFHVCAMTMEIFKTSPAVGSWSYPEPAFFAIATVPLFSGFLYSSVGSYMARAWRINKFSFSALPKRSVLFFIGIIIYANFFTNHFIIDLRWPIFIVVVAIFWKTKLRVQLTSKVYTIHPLVSNALLALFVWFAEQIGTFARAWVYPNQSVEWTPVPFHMFTSWYMLLIFSFVIIALINQSKEA